MNVVDFFTMDSSSLLTGKWFWDTINFVFLGLPNCVLTEAAAKSKEFEITYGMAGEESEDNLCNHAWVDNTVTLIQKLISLESTIRCNDETEKNGIGSLKQLQQQARILVQQG